MNIDAEENERADMYLELMIRAIKQSQKKGGFDNYSVTLLVHHWLKVGQLLRSPLYVREYIIEFVRSQAPVANGGRKASEVLLTRLQRLVGYPVTAGVDPHVVYFNEAQKAMITFVDQYRKALAQSDAAQLNAFMERLLIIRQAGKVY